MAKGLDGTLVSSHQSITSILITTIYSSIMLIPPIVGRIRMTTKPTHAYQALAKLLPFSPRPKAPFCVPALIVAALLSIYVPTYPFSLMTLGYSDSNR